MPAWASIAGLLLCYNFLNWQRIAFTLPAGI